MKTKKDYDYYKENPYELSGVTEEVKKVDLGWVEFVDTDTGQVYAMMAKPKKVRSSVDSLSYKKVYNGMFEIMRDMKSEGLRLMLWVMLNTKVGKDYIDINYNDCYEWCKFKTRKPFHTALLAMLDKKVIAMSTVRNRYFINVNLFYNGKRKL